LAIIYSNVNANTNNTIFFIFYKKIIFCTKVLFDVQGLKVKRRCPYFSGDGVKWTNRTNFYGKGNILRIRKLLYSSQKSNKRLMVRSITWETKREGQRQAKNCTTHRNQKKGKKLVPIMVGSYLTHTPSNVACT
jgi:hypothetical protein